MKIAILGSKGIPNEYGGFEQFAEYLSCGLVRKGHAVTVYNPGFHSYTRPEFHGVEIIKKSDPEGLFGSAANIIYDYLCLKDALTRKFDLILECGYGSLAPALLLCNISRTPIVTNMDGMEWQRSKWNVLSKKFLKWSEKYVVKKCRAIVSDNIHVKNYYQRTYGTSSDFIPYGATVLNTFDESVPAKYGLEKEKYYLVIARFEPENNLHLILQGYENSGATGKIMVVGDVQARYGRSIKSHFRNKNIIYAGNIYEQADLNSLRHFSKIYFHGHSVGGTNPSLLEAMGAGALIVSHHNIFNESVLGDDAMYFKSAEDISKIIATCDVLPDLKAGMIKNNLAKIESMYNWEKIVDRYEELFLRLCKS